MGKLVLAITGGIAEFERSLIRRRCQDGIDHPRARGKLFGRRPKLDADQRSKVAERYPAARR